MGPRDDDDEAWIHAQVEVAGSIEVVHERPWATVRRVPIAGGVAWFKACAPVQAFEPRLTAALARRLPDRLPAVLAHDEERAWLLLGDAGEPLGFDGGPEPWLAVLPRYAELQRGEAAHVAEHLAGGVQARRLGDFPALYESMLTRELPLAAGDLAQLRAFVPCGGTPRILDWGGSCLSHPFLTLFVTFLHLDGLAPGDPWLARLRDAYLEPWGRAAELRDTVELAQRLGPFAHVFKELHAPVRVQHRRWLGLSGICIWKAVGGSVFFSVFGAFTRYRLASELGAIAPPISASVKTDARRSPLGSSSAELR